MSDASQSPVAFARGVPCIGCGYDLDGCAVGGVCPECGKAGAETLGSVWLWPAEEVRRVRGGLRLALMAALLGPGLYLAAAIAGGLLGIMVEVIAGMVAVVAPIGPILAVVGLARACRPMAAPTVEGRRLAHAAAGPPPRGLVWTGVGFALCSVLGAVVGVVVGLFQRDGAMLGLVGIVLFVCAGALWSVRNWLVLACLRDMARRCGAGRTVAWMGAMRFGAAALAGWWLGMALMVPAARLVPPGWSEFFMIAGAALYLATVAWLLAWIVLLIAFGRTLRRVERSRPGRDGVEPAVGAAPACVPLPDTQ